MDQMKNNDEVYQVMETLPGAYCVVPGKLGMDENNEPTVTYTDSLLGVVVVDKGVAVTGWHLAKTLALDDMRARVNIKYNMMRRAAENQLKQIEADRTDRLAAVTDAAEEADKGG